MTIRAVYLEVATTTVNLVATPLVGERWNEAGVLPGMTVGALAAHLTRSLSQVETGLAQPVPTGPLLDAVEYYAAVQAELLDPDSEVNAGVVERAEETAAVGHDALVAQSGASLDRLRAALADEPGDRTVVGFGTPMLLDEYLRTRLVELTVHLDDLAVSLGLEPVVVAPAGYAVAIDVLVQLARQRSGDLAVLRALTRRDRSVGDPLRVL